MRIGVDLDGVIVDFHKDWGSAYWRDFQSYPGTIDCWDSFVEATHFSSKNQFWKWLQTTDVWWNSEALPGAIESLHQLADNHSIIIITSKPQWAHERTLYWLSQRGIPSEEIHFTGKRKKKYTIMCDAYIDDSPYNLEDYVIYRPQATVFRMIQPWNYPLPNTISVHSIAEITQYI